MFEERAVSSEQEDRHHYVLSYSPQREGIVSAIWETRDELLFFAICYRLSA